MIGITDYRSAVIKFNAPENRARITPQPDGPAFPFGEEVMSEQTNSLLSHHFIHPFQHRKKGGNK